MKIATTTVLLLALSLVVTCASPEKAPIFPLNQRFEQRAPATQADVDWFCGAKGMTEDQALAQYGTPTKTERMPNGNIRWFYPWVAIAYLDIKNGVVVDAWYDGGY